MDKRSTIAVGGQDFTIFANLGRVFLVECKRKGEKLSPEQLAWKLEMEMAGHTVHTVWSYAEFLEIVK